MANSEITQIVNGKYYVVDEGGYLCFMKNGKPVDPYVIESEILRGMLEEIIALRKLNNVSN